MIYIFCFKTVLEVSMANVTSGIIVAVIALMIGFIAIYPYCLYLKGIDDRPLPFRVNEKGDIVPKNAIDQQDDELGP